MASPDEFGFFEYGGMWFFGTLGSMLGGLGAMVVAGGAILLTDIVSGGCINCGPLEGGALIPLAVFVGAGTTLAAATSVAFGANAFRDPESGGEFWGSMGRAVRAPEFRPALLGAVLGVGVGAELGLLLEPVSTPENPYWALGYAVGQAGTSVLVVALSHRGR